GFVGAHAAISPASATTINTLRLVITRRTPATTSRRNADPKYDSSGVARQDTRPKAAALRAGPTAPQGLCRLRMCVRVMEERANSSLLYSPPTSALRHDAHNNNRADFRSEHVTGVLCR